MSDSESDFQEIKINTIKKEIQQNHEQREKDRQKQRKNKKVSLLKKYEEKVLDNKELVDVENLVETKKVIGSLNKTNLYTKTLFEKDGFLIEVAESSKVNFKPINKSISNQLTNHLYGGRITRKNIKNIN